MDDVLPDLQVLLPTGGVLTLVVWFVIRLAVEGRQDRRDWRTAREELHARNAALRTELDEARAAAQVELAALRNELETERRRRWKAEDAAAEYRRQLGLGVNGEPRP